MSPAGPRAGTGLPPDTPAYLQQGSQPIRVSPLPALVYAFLTPLANKYPLNTYTALGTGDTMQGTGAQAPIRPPEGSAWLSSL